MNRRVVITGLGMVTPLGLDAQTTWDALLAGNSGLGLITQFKDERFGDVVAAEVKDFDPTAFMDRKVARRTDRFIQFAFVAADEALRMAKYETRVDNQHRVATIIGTAVGGVLSMARENEVLQERGPGRISPFLMTQMLPDMASGQLSIRLGAKGVNFSVTSACASGADAIGVGAAMIRQGEVDVAITGGSEAAITPLVVAGFAAAKALTESRDPRKASRPFDLNRDGFVMAEGAGVLVLEEEGHALARGATILAELAGYGATSDAYHVTQPAENASGATRAMQAALEDANATPDDIDYLNAHGTSTPLNDKFETMAAKQVFGDHAYTMPISSTKSATGHLLGAAGAIEAAISIQALQHSAIPPTINYETPDPACDLDYVPNVARSAPLRAVMSNAFGFGGHNSSLIFQQHARSI
ncbi:MAG: beta-ketoacyl-[acyl-carrier-protein] synthase II [Dehalococcoidia bacterium]|nr:beta-ketoacyl-[acyl-carrier-protein] synthase II [Dehalococcoidia bacterium]HCV00088.1 beta-ketoacyl-[acyl-carrier-protein] synthase II [Dehalococcoidia bacterium]